MVSHKECPSCGNTNEFTFHLHYAYVNGSKSKIDYRNAFYYCIDCDYKSKTFCLDDSFSKMLNTKEKSISIVSIPPRHEILKKENIVVETKKIKLVLEIDKATLSDALLSLEKGGFSDVQVLFDKEGVV